MALLLNKMNKKVKAATLIEVLVASVLIVVVFSIASLALNTIFKSVIKNNNVKVVATRIDELSYLYKHRKVDIKYKETYNGWTISVSKQNRNNQSFILIEAIDKINNKKISKQFIDVEDA